MMWIGNTIDIPITRIIGTYQVKPQHFKLVQNIVINSKLMHVEPALKLYNCMC